jgi:hypothetical protein
MKNQDNAANAARANIYRQAQIDIDAVERDFYQQLGYQATGPFEVMSRAIDYKSSQNLAAVDGAAFLLKVLDTEFGPTMELEQPDLEAVPKSDRELPRHIDRLFQLPRVSVALKEYVMNLGEDYWQLSETELWTRLTTLAFGTTDLEEQEKLFPRKYIKSIYERLIKLLKLRSEIAIHFPPDGNRSEAWRVSLFYKCFPSLTGQLKHPIQVLVTPLGFVFYLHSEDHQLLGDAGGFFFPTIPDSEVRGIVMTVNTSDQKPESEAIFETNKDIQGHELQHSYYHNFHQEIDLADPDYIADLAAFNRIEEEDVAQISMDWAAHRRSIALLSKRFLEREKDEIISYRTYNTPDMNDISIGKWFEYIFIRVADKLESYGLDATYADPIVDLYREAFRDYQYQKDRLRQKAGELYARADELHYDKKELEALLQMTAVDKIFQLLDILLSPIHGMPQRLKQSEKPHEETAFGVFEF